VTLYRDRYRIESARLKGWDYASAGCHFVTICTGKRKCFFGEVVAGEIRLSMAGEITAEEWQRTEQVRSNVVLDRWVVMPNHLHGIIVIRNPVETPRRGVSTRASSAPASPLRPDSLGSIIGQFKSVCTKRIRAAGVRDFCWQTRFYDRIVRNEGALSKVRQCIDQNPVRWDLDVNNPTNLRA
jgi:putative transposase